MSEVNVKPKPEGLVTVPRARLAMPSLFAPNLRFDPENTQCDAKLLIAPDDPIVPVIKAAMLKVAKTKWGVKGESQYKALDAADKTCLHKGDAKSDWEGFDGMLYIAAKTKPNKRPKLLGPQLQVLTEDDGTLYSGCYVKAQFNIWAMDNGFGKRLNAELLIVQYVGKGDAFSGGARPDESEFDEIAAPDESEADDIAG